jgi:hypothetical protein
LAHCHVYVGSESAYVVAIDPRATVLDPDGSLLPRKARKLVLDHLEKIRDAWNSANPDHPIQ